MTFKRWMQEHHGATVETVQLDTKRGTTWEPGPRVIDAETRASYVLLDGSRRDYAGMKVERSTDDSIVVSDDWHHIRYSVIN